MTPVKRIVALGGGGFSMESQNLALDRWILSLIDAERPRVCFLPTASGDAPGYARKFHSAFGRLSCEPSVLQEYRFNTGQAVHRFCTTCGVHSHYTPRSHPGKVDVNVRCISDLPMEELTIEPFDGKNWEENVDEIQ